MLGGIRMPSVPPAQMQPAMSGMLYLTRIRAGMASRPDRDLGRAHDAGRGGEDGAGDDDRDAEAPADPAHDDVHGLEEPLGDAGGVQDLGHEDEERHGHEHVLLHDAVGPVGQKRQNRADRPAPADHAEDDGQCMPRENARGCPRSSAKNSRKNMVRAKVSGLISSPP